MLDFQPADFLYFTLRHPAHDAALRAVNDQLRDAMATNGPRNGL
jgi:hypothetical protein